MPCPACETRRVRIPEHHATAYRAELCERHNSDLTVLVLERAIACLSIPANLRESYQRHLAAELAYRAHKGFGALRGAA